MSGDITNNVPLPSQRSKNGRRLFANEAERLEEQRRRSRERQRKRRQNPEELAKDAKKMKDKADAMPIDKRRTVWREKQANYSKRNKEYLAKYQRDRRAKNPNIARAANLKSNYGITTQQFEQMFINQGSCCAICKRLDSGGKNWHVDHCHETNKVRGILCHWCNIALGGFMDSVNILNAAIQYVSKGGL